MKILLILIIGTLPLFVFGQENWLIDKNGCKVFNPHPRKHEGVEWTGNCIDSVATGYGQLIWYLHGKKTNNIYTGNMINGRPEGDGLYIKDLNSSVTTYEGKYKNGEIIYGKKINKFRKDSSLYIGELKNWEANGQGVEYFSFDTWFKGEFKDNYFKKGIYTFTSEGYSIESEDWKFNFPQRGKVRWNDGTIYEGEFKNYQPHGKGTILYTDGKRFSGTWKKGELIKNACNTLE